MKKKVIYIQKLRELTSSNFISETSKFVRPFFSKGFVENYFYIRKTPDIDCSDQFELIIRLSKETYSKIKRKVNCFEQFLDSFFLTKPKTILKDSQLMKLLFIVYYNLDIQTYYFDESYIKYQILIECFPSKKDINMTPGVIALKERSKLKPQKDNNHHQIEFWLLSLN